MAPSINSNICDHPQMTFLVRREFWTVAIVAVVLTGCGGGDDDSGGGVPFAEGGAAKGTPTSEEVVGCLKTAGSKTGFTVSEAPADLDAVARKASDRALAIDAGGEKTIVIIQRTEQEAGTVVDQYRSGPIDERGAGYTQSGTIVLVDKGNTPAAQRKGIVDCTKYGTKEQGAGGAAAPALTTTKPEPLDLDANTAEVHERSEVADADFGTVELLKVQDPRPGKRPFMPAAGSRFIGVTFRLTSKARLGYRGFTLYGKNDKRYYEVPDPDAFSGGTIDKGQTKRGMIIFEVPKSVTADTLRFHVDAPVGAEESIEIQLK
jgi:hypothetical protein